MLKYQSQEWIDQVMEKSKTDPTYVKKAKGFNEKFRAINTDCPGNTDVMIIWEFDDGKIVKATRMEEPAPTEWRNWKNEDGYLSTTIGDYAKMVKVASGEANAQLALAKKWYTVQGNMIKIFGKMGKLNAFSDLAASVECEY